MNGTTFRCLIRLHPRASPQISFQLHIRFYCNLAIAHLADPDVCNTAGADRRLRFDDLERSLLHPLTTAGQPRSKVIMDEVDETFNPPWK